MPSGVRGALGLFQLMALLLQLEAVPWAEEHSVAERRWPGALTSLSRRLEDPGGSQGALSDFIGQRIYFRNGNSPCPRGSQSVSNEIKCIEGADETIDVQGICDSMGLSACLERRNESSLPEGCFTMELLGSSSLVFNAGGSATACHAPAFCDIICVKLPPGLQTTLTATSSTSTTSMTTTSQTWTLTSSTTSYSRTETSTRSSTTSASSTMTTVTATATTSSSSSTSSVTTSITRTTTTSSTSESEMEPVLNVSNSTFNESQTSTTEFLSWLNSSDDSDEASDDSLETDESEAMSMSDKSKAAETREASPLTLSRGLNAPSRVNLRGANVPAAELSQLG